MQTIETIKQGNLICKIVQDSDPESPRNWDNVGTMVCFHRRYNLGDKHKFADSEEVMSHIKKTKATWLPLYLMDHSGISMSVGDFGCPWDSGQVGVIFVEPSKIKSEKITKAQALNNLKCEVETYNQYLTGDVYGYSIEKPDTCTTCSHVDNESLESCWGFFGLDNCKSEAIAAMKGLEK